MWWWHCSDCADQSVADVVQNPDPFLPQGGDSRLHTMSKGSQCHRNTKWQHLKFLHPACEAEAQEPLVTPPDGYLEIRIFELYGSKPVSCSDYLSHSGDCQQPASQGSEIFVEPEVQDRVKPPVSLRVKDIMGEKSGLVIPRGQQCTALPPAGV